MNANTNANIDDFEFESEPEFDFDYGYEPTPLAMAYTTAQVLYDIDCKFTQYIDLLLEPDEGYFIRLELWKEIREWYFEMEFEEEDDWNQSSETNDNRSYSSDVLFFEGLSRMIQSYAIVRYGMPVYVAKAPSGPPKDEIDEKMLLLFIAKTKDIHANALEEKRVLFNRFVIVFNVTSTKRCRRGNRTYAKAEREVKRQCIEDARAELFSHDKTHPGKSSNRTNTFLLPTLYKDIKVSSDIPATKLKRAVKTGILSLTKEQLHGSGATLCVHPETALKIQKAKRAGRGVRILITSHEVEYPMTVLNGGGDHGGSIWSKIWSSLKSGFKVAKDTGILSKLADAAVGPASAYTGSPGVVLAARNGLKSLIGIGLSQPEGGRLTLADVRTAGSKALSYAKRKVILTDAVDLVEKKLIEKVERPEHVDMIKQVRKGV
ncbi:unnamed protein product [Phytophthora fragariaefolia]|uniref:Unnamed protein product n=1 Tax=Phytophthora fragariaefolia TaxID=1490495 RepID=A0A9W6TZ29_9STRA|nr:unnamed protein product [Phytophthora fragariaefolia]